MDPRVEQVLHTLSQKMKDSIRIDVWLICSNRKPVNPFLKL
jgi:hypothetical protein